MPRHSLPRGKAFIQTLVDLGTLLGYHVEQEFPVDEVEHGDPPAVDVAWFAEAGQEYPLMIFEVESTSGNTLANNAMKVYGQENKRFEKPLFFFHIILSGGTESSRIANLERQFGTHNYRLYVFGRDGADELIGDILAQHKRVYNHADHFEMYELLCNSLSDILDPVAVLKHGFQLGLSPERKLSTYVHLALSHAEILKELPSILVEERKHRWHSLSSLSTYIGSQWGVLPLSSLMIRTAMTDKHAIGWNNTLMQWQDNASYLPMIAPAFGLAHDYDEFLIGLSAPLIALSIGVAGERGLFRSAMCEVLVQILKALRPGLHGLPTAAWICHIASRFNMPTYYSAACDFIMRSGGISGESLLSPPSIFNEDNPDLEEYLLSCPVVTCPDLQDFRTHASTQHGPITYNPELLALNAVVDDSFIFEWSQPILSVLWSE